MVERQKRPSHPGAGTRGGPPPATDPSSPGARRILDRPANDNRPSAAQRIARIALFVAIGAAISWLLRELAG